MELPGREKGVWGELFGCVDLETCFEGVGEEKRHDFHGVEYRLYIVNNEVS